jgi:hypothetical protein
VCVCVCVCVCGCYQRTPALLIFFSVLGQGFTLIGKKWGKKNLIWVAQTLNTDGFPWCFVIFPVL